MEAPSSYSLVGHGSSLFIFLIRQNDKGVFLRRVDAVDRNITSEIWCNSFADAKALAKEETGNIDLNWKEIPSSEEDSISYIFTHEPRLTIRLNLRPEREAMPFVVKLVWADFLMTSLISLTEYLTAGSVLVPGMAEIIPMESISPGSVTLLFFALNLVFTLTLAFKISEGARWARTTFALSCAVTLFTFVFQPGQIFVHSAVIGILTILQAVIEIYALFLLYSGEGKEAFNHRKKH